MILLERSSFARMECPIARALEEVGDGWSLLLIREALKGLRQFAEFQERLGIAPNTLTRRLDKLCSHGILVRCPYQDHPPRDEYRLTKKGLELLPILLALGGWGNRWVFHGDATIVPVDLRTGDPIDLAIVDRRTGNAIEPGRVGVAAGSGASRELRARLARPLPLGAESSISGSQPELPAAARHPGRSTHRSKPGSRAPVGSSKSRRPPGYRR
jgi:DNA-binding HxlR family transcriptional regulator